MGTSTCEAARDALRHAIDRWDLAAAAFLRDAGPDPVHDLRVALRHARSVLLAYRKILPKRIRAARAELRWLTQVAGEARDLDVLALQTLPALEMEGLSVPAVFMSRLAVARDRAAMRLRRALRSRRHALLRETLASELDALDDGGGPVRRYAMKRLGKQEARLARAARGSPSMGDAARHALRIEAKRLRYMWQGFPPPVSRREARPWLTALAALQEDLGRAQDVVVARRLLEALGARGAFARGARTRLDQEHAAACATIPSRVRNVIDASPVPGRKRRARLLHS